MDSISPSIGFIIGLGINVFAQYLVWRYFFVYYLKNGNKSAFEKDSTAPTIAIIVFSLIIYGSAASNKYIGLAFLIGIIYFAVTLKKKWDQNDILPDPFSNR